MRRSKFQTPVHAYGWKLPPIQQTTKSINLMKVQNIFPIAKVETNDKLRELSRERETLYFRLAIQPNGDENSLNDAQKALLAKLGDKAKKITLNGQLNREISNIFPATILADEIDGLDKLTADDLTDEMQDDLVAQIFDLLKEEEGFIFTYYTFSVSDLLKGTEYSNVDKLYTENGSIVRQRNNLYFGFFDDEEEAFSFMKGRLIDAIENEDLLIENPNGETETETETTKAETEKPKITLKRK